MTTSNRHPATTAAMLPLLAFALAPDASLAQPGRGGPPIEPIEELNPIRIDEWPTPWQGRGRDPYAAGPDEIWFVGQQGHYLARFTPSTEEFLRVALPDGTGPHNNIVQSNGIVWYSGNRVGNIGAYDPKTEEFTIIEMPDPVADRDPHTLVFDDSEEHIWFTVQQGNKIGRLTLADSKVEIVPVPTPNSRPYGIRIAPDGTPWIVLLGTNKLAKMDPETLALTEIEIPWADARPRRLEISSDGRIWYADFGRGPLGMYDPATGEFEEFEMPGGAGARPYGTAIDEFDRVWVVPSGPQPNVFVGFDTEDEKIFSITAIPSGARTVRHMDYEEETGTVWFGTDTENLARAVVRPD